MARGPDNSQSGVVSGGDRPPQIEGEEMKSLLTSTLLTVVAVPFLMAAPTAPKQDSTQSTTSQTKKAKKHKKSTTSTESKTTNPSK
jgi:hypothetical protein